ncbi:MAG: ABC transporter permease [Planctomycetes bacterium]|nr:ABC transporter permease [Planctomycetota bacterium]
MSMWEGVLDALENILSNPMRAFLTMLGVIIGVFSVVTLVSIGEGAKKYVTDQFAGLGTNVLIITPGKSQTSGGPPMTGTAGTRPLTAEDTRNLVQRCPSVEHVSPVILGTAAIKWGNKLRDQTMVVGTTYEHQMIRNIYADVGSFLPQEEGQGQKRVCVLGRNVVKDLFPAGDNPLGEYVRVGGTRFQVIGLMERKGYSLGFDIDGLVWIPLRAAEQIFDKEDLFEVLVRARPGQLEQAKDEVRRALVARHDGYEDFTITSQAQMIQSLASILDVLTYAISGIAAISLLVGGIGIMNIMLVTVGEKTREIGIRKAVGASRRDILWQFLVESSTISGIGGAIGIAVGVGLALLVHAVIPSLPVLIRPWTIAISFSFALAVGLFFGVYPAKKAADLDPIEALRYE